MTVVIPTNPGPRGANGNTIWTTSGVPASTVGTNGDFALDPTAQVLYGPKAAGAWPAPGVSVKGNTGPAGSIWRTGSGAPSNSLGVDGDLYLNAATSDVYQRASGAYAVIANVKGSQGIPGANAKYVTGTSYLGLVATRGKNMTSNNTAALQHMARSIHVARANITNIGVAFANWTVGVGAEHNCGADATIQAAIEYPLGGTIYPLLFSGSSSGVVKDYSTLLSDLLTITIPSGATFAVREYRVCGAGGGTPYANTLAIDTIDGDCYQYGSSVANLVNNVGSFSSTGTVFYKPVAIFGTTTLPSYALLGDSRVEGYSDTSNGNLHIGEFERTVGLTRAFTNFGVGGDQIGSIMWGNGNAVVQFGQAFAQRAAIIRKFCTHILCNYGVNDMFSSSAASAGGLISYITAIRREFPAHYWYQSIPMGEATSTDNFITVGNQSLANPTAETQRRLYANALRAGALGTLVDGVFDTASVVESSPNSGLWKVPGGGGGYTIDGVHCLAAGYQLIQTSGVINVM